MSDWCYIDTLFLLAILLAFAWNSTGDEITLEPAPFTVDNGIP